MIAWFLPAMIDLPADLERPAQVAAVIATLTLGMQAPLGLFSSLLKGAQRFDVLNAGGIASIVAYAVLVIVVLTRHNTLPTLATHRLHRIAGPALHSAVLHSPRAPGPPS